MSCALRLQAVRDLLPYAAAGDAAEDLTPAQQQRLKEILDRLDREGQLVYGWRGSQPIPQECLADLHDRLKFWAFRHVPEYCWATLDLGILVDDLRSALQRQSAGYTFGEDLLVWAIPILSGRLAECIGEAARRVRPDVDLSELRPFLQSRARDILARLGREVGIGGIDARDAAQGALLLLLGAGDEEYLAQRRDPWGWAESKLKTLLGLRIQFQAEPDLGPSWDAAPEAAERELRKRRVLLEAFAAVQPCAGPAQGRGSRGAA